MQPKADVLFEVSWEVCNKVGGIYTVVKSKAAQMAKYYKDDYYLIGPYFARNAQGELSEEAPPEFCREAFSRLKNEGIVCHFGKWLIEGSPNVILIDFEAFRQKTNEIKKELWDNFKVDSIRAGYDYDEPLVWSTAAGMLIEKISAALKGKKIVAQFHEWLAGAGLLYLKNKHSAPGTVFTTHATILGRTLASSDVDLYNVWDKINPEEEAKKYGIESKFTLEKQAAQNAEVFTTVSEITAMEAEHILGRKADVLVLNGLDMEKFPTFEELSIKHKVQRERIREFLLSYFFPYYTFDMGETLIYFMVGRYEFKDKGIDIFIKSLGLLNKRLKEEGSKKTVVAFIWVPANVKNIKQDILENKTYYQDIKDSLDEVMDDVKVGIINSILSGRKITEFALFEKGFLTEIKSKFNRFKRKGLPPVSTHDLHGEDTIINALRESGLSNSKEDSVKVIYYPIYLGGADGLLNLNYYEAMQGSHLGVFPSYYEPWGYTPLEAGALGVASITSDLAGFGRFFCKECVQTETQGIYVINRLNKGDNDAILQLTGVMHHFSKLSKEGRTANKMQARKIASTCDWQLFVKNYIDAHNLAVDRLNKQK